MTGRNEADFDDLMQPWSQYLDDGQTPVLVFCVNASRIGTDIERALRGVNNHRPVLVVLHNKNQSYLRGHLSEYDYLLDQTLRDRVIGIAHFAFSESDGFYSCRQNEDGFRKLKELKEIKQPSTFKVHWLIKRCEQENPRLRDVEDQIMKHSERSNLKTEITKNSKKEKAKLPEPNQEKYSSEKKARYPEPNQVWLIKRCEQDNLAVRTAEKMIITKTNLHEMRWTQDSDNGQTPVLVFCVNASRISSDVENALRGVKVSDHRPVLVVLHCIIIPSLRGGLSDDEYLLVQALRDRVAGIAHFAFSESDGLYSCHQNKDGFIKLKKLIKDKELKKLKETRNTLNKAEAETCNHQSALALLEAEKKAHKDTQENLAQMQQALEDAQNKLTKEKADLAETGFKRERASAEKQHEIHSLLAAEKQHHESTKSYLAAVQRTLKETQRSHATEKQDHVSTKNHLAEVQRTLEETQRRSALQERDHEERRLALERDLAGEQQAHEVTRNNFREAESTITGLREALEELRNTRHENEPDWVLARNEIQMTNREIGKGAWGSVMEGRFRGSVVAVKQIHDLILSPYNQRLFEREMNTASRCLHPCLLQFIGATNDDGRSPLLVTELLDTNLRAVLQERTLEPDEITTIALDVARALNYLHLNRPHPIVHRDISSANVLLWKRGECWRAKVSVYSTANFMQDSMTQCPDAVVSFAPETQTARQSPKVDVYSYGVLLCEMIIRELPEAQRRYQQVAMITNRSQRDLIRRCLTVKPEDRPSMEEIILELERQ